MSAVGSSIAVYDTPALAALDATNLSLGTIVYVTSATQMYQLTVSSASVGSGVVAVLNSANYRWLLFAPPLADATTGSVAVAGDITSHGGTILVAYSTASMDLFDAGSTGAAVTIVPARAGRKFHVSAIEVVPTLISGTITGNPKISAGSDAGTFVDLVNNVTTGNLSANVFVNVATSQLIQDMTGDLKVFVSTAATGTSSPGITGYVVARGWWV